MPKCTDFMPKKVDFGTERVDLGLLGLISSLKEPDLGLGRDIWIDRWTDRQKGKENGHLHDFCFSLFPQ